VLVTRRPAWLFERPDAQDESLAAVAQYQFIPESARPLASVARARHKAALMTACGVSIVASARGILLLSSWSLAYVDPFALAFRIVLYAIGARWAIRARRPEGPQQ
jgi:hypothetical protein